MAEFLNINVMLDRGAFMPEKAFKADAGWDLRTPECFELKPGETAEIDLGIHVQIPEGYVGFLKSKSGLNTQYGITSEGVIDSGYTGSIKAKLRRDQEQENKLLIERGDKITQLVFIPIPNVKLTMVTSFPETERGCGGFGSTGR